MAAKTTLAVTLASGRVATRTTAHEYTHAVIQDGREHLPKRIARLEASLAAATKPYDIADLTQQLAHAKAQDGCYVFGWSHSAEGADKMLRESQKKFPNTPATVVTPYRV